MIDWQQQAEQYFIQENYSEVIRLYEQAIEAEPQVKSHYWYLGLTLLLQGQEEEAHTTWLLGMVEGDSEQIEEWTAQLIEILQIEAQKRESVEDDSVAWLIRQHIRELNPTDINNLLNLVLLAIRLEHFTGDDLKEWEVISLLETLDTTQLDTTLLLRVLAGSFKNDPLNPVCLELASASWNHLYPNKDYRNVLLLGAIEVGYGLKYFIGAAALVKIALKENEHDVECLRHLAAFYQNAGEYRQGIETAQLCYSLVTSLPDKIFANHMVLRGFMTAGGYWQQSYAALQEQKSLITSQIEQEEVSLDPVRVSRVLTSFFFAPYLQDYPQENRVIQNQLSQVCQSYIQTYRKENVERYQEGFNRTKQSKKAKHPLKIGYLCSCLGQHSVGWLARGLFQHHDYENWEIHGYFVNYRETGDPVKQWYMRQVSHAHPVDISAEKIADQIFEDEIDILVDLDSLTLDTTCEVMALKPAPIQVTWLGWDASGLPAIDYFIADPYVLPNSAQNYYAEKIWRLPHSYVAVDGFEVAIPSLRRDHLEIPSDAVVYFSGQRGYKRHIETARLQMKIIKEVPNSYFLIKGISDEESMKKFFGQLAEEEGVSFDQLRFLPEVNLESIHRANLGIADVVLDTYPYNGATTTMETLWMCIPMVTKVGQQFAARNSYTMMMNAGVTEGIAWTNEEYVDWGIRLGKDATLRQQISWRLRQSRQTSPLWNAKQFAGEMEKAYQQMWNRYLQEY
jgi:predicted O-linked N-acetylglucosamine transferase (SPINDLY family)